jgi:pimeloyl-ACP methyl ester carboxylesterase
MESIKTSESRKSGGGAARFVWRTARALLLAYLGVLLLACLAQRRLMYFPDPAPVSKPIHPRYAALEEVELKAADGVSLKAWDWPGKLPMTLVVFHGNAGHRGNRLAWLEALRKTGAGVFILDYRGYGGSGGSPSEKGLYQDAEAAVAWLTERGRGPLVYVGESLGSAVAVEMAVRRPPAALVLQGAFSSAVEVARAAYPYLPVSLLMWDRFESLKKMEHVACPLLMIQGAEDSLVSPEMARQLFERAPGRKEWLLVPGARHNDALWDLEPTYSDRLRTFLGL